MEENVKSIIDFIGDDKNRKGLLETPVRVKRWHENFFTYNKRIMAMSSEERNGNNLPKDVVPITIFDNSEDYDEIIVKKGEFVSICEHHMVFFYGKFRFAYLPNKFIIGESKIGDIVKYFSGRLQLQEYLGKQIVDWFVDNVKPAGCMLILEAKHFCEYVTTGKITPLITSVVSGKFLQHDLKQETMKLFEMSGD